MALEILLIFFTFSTLAVGQDISLAANPGSIGTNLLPLDTTSTTSSTTTPSTTTCSNNDTTTTSTTPTTTSTTTVSSTSSSTTTPATTTIAPGLCTKPGSFCQDCQTLMICSQAGSPPVQKISCMQQNLFKPYCDISSNQCTDINTCKLFPMFYPGYISPVSTSCIKQERRPDPLNCGQYVDCIPDSTGKTFTGYTTLCPIGQHYNPLTGSCGILETCTDIKFFCFGKSGVLIPFLNYPSIYGYCPRFGTAEQYLVFQCRGEYTFDPVVSKCVPVCKREGPMVVNENCKQFYFCTRNLFSYSMNLNNCPNGMGFNPATRTCDPSYSNCTAISP